MSDAQVPAGGEADVQVPAVLVLEDGGANLTRRVESPVAGARSAVVIGGGVSEER